MEYILSAATDVGLTKNTNQDSYNAKCLTTSLGRVAFLIVCDGMGGLSKGELASATVICEFDKWVRERLPYICQTGLNDAIIRSEWTDVITGCNEKIRRYGKYNGFELGTTVTAMLLTQQRYYVINVGDSRAYEIKENIKVLTKDQTVIAREVEVGNLTEEQAKTDPRRSVLLQCVGVLDSVCPDIYFGDTQKDAVYLLCSDGFRHEISPDEIFQYLNPNMSSGEETIRGNISCLIELNKQRQETDNITAVVARTY